MWNMVVHENHLANDCMSRHVTFLSMPDPELLEEKTSSFCRNSDHGIQTAMLYV